MKKKTNFIRQHKDHNPKKKSESNLRFANFGVQLHPFEFAFAFKSDFWWVLLQKIFQEEWQTSSTANVINMWHWSQKFLMMQLRLSEINVNNYECWTFPQISWPMNAVFQLQVTLKQSKWWDNAFFQNGILKKKTRVDKFDISVHAIHPNWGSQPACHSKTSRTLRCLLKFCNRWCFNANNFRISESSAK